MAKPSPVAKKSGMGCCGCGCAFLALLALLFFGLVGAGCYLLYYDAVKVTTTTPATIPTFDGGDDVYSGAMQKMKAFNHDVENHLPATIHLTADEINTMISRNPNFSKNNIQVYVTMRDDQARVQSSIPSGLLSYSTIKGRYLNADIAFTVSFDNQTKMISLNLKNAQIGNTAVPESNLAGLQAGTDPMINALLQKNTGYPTFIQQVNSIEIKNSELVIETK